jgi:dUTP pyrophosphatase
MSDVSVRIVRGESAADIPLPAYETPFSSGMDLRSTADYVLLPGERIAVGTGLVVEIPEGYEFQVRPRSGLALRHGVTVLNAPGTIDSDYRGEIRVILVNLGLEPFTITRGDRIAQMILARTEHVSWIEEAAVSETQRGEGGFGSSGVK